MAPYDEQMPSSPAEESQPPGNPRNSAPSTPQLASTSDAFQLYNSKISADTKGKGLLSGVGNFRDERPSDDLSKLHSSAFNDLRKSINEAGEGFVRRMREYEAHRNSGHSIASKMNSPSDKSTPRYRRGRKRPSAASPYQSSYYLPKFGSSSGNEDPDEESDVEIHSSCVSSSDNNASSSKKRAVSLGSSYSREPVSSTFARPDPFRRPLQDRERSSLSCESSDDDENSIVLQSGVLRPGQNQQQGAPRFRQSANEFSPPSLSFSFSSASNNSSRMSLPLAVPSPVSYTNITNSPSSSPSQQSTFPKFEANSPRVSPKSSKRTDKAVAALSLALANGAGSVSDYEALREAQNALGMDDSETGSMWD